MPVSSRGPGGVGPGDATRLSSTPSTCTPAKRAGSSDAACRHGLMWDHTVFHVVASCRARSDGGSFEAQLSDRPADRPGAQTRPGCAHPLVMFQECHRLAGVFAAYPSALVPPDPCRNPGPGRVDHLHHHTPVALSDSAHTQGSQPAGCTTQHRTPEPLGCELHSSDGNPPNRRADHTDHTDHNDQATQNSSRQGQTPPKVLDDSGGRRPLIIKDLDLYPQPPVTHTQLGRALKPPDPHRDPGPGRVDHLHHHTPVALSKSPHNQGTPPAGCTTQHRAPEHLGCEPRSSDGSPPNRRADHTDHNDQATHSSSR